MLDPSNVPAVILSLLVTGAIATYYLSSRNRVYGEHLVTVITLVVLGLALFLIPPISRGETVESAYSFLSLPLAVSFRVDGLSLYMGLLIAFLWALAARYSRGYMSHSHARPRYYAFLLLAQATNLGVVFAADLVGFLLFFELMAITSYFLVAHEEDDYALFAGNKYIYMSIAGGLGLFFSLLITYHLVGKTAFGQGPLISEPSLLATAAFFGFLVSFGIKIGMFPLHVWLPDAHPAAPAPVSALLSGIMIKIGAYGLFRAFFDVFGIELIREMGLQNITLTLAVITILLGSALALLQDDLKRRLAYSSIAQIGYILLGLSLLTDRALTGAVFHIFTHAMMKGCLFMCAGAIIVQTGKRKISDMKGIGLQMPVTMICFTLATLSMVGIPPFNGFISKLQLAMGALDAGEPVYVFLLIFSSMLNAAYYFPIVIAAFFATPKEEAGLKLEAGLVMMVPIGILAAMTFLLALGPYNWPLQLARLISKGFIGL